MHGPAIRLGTTRIDYRPEIDGLRAVAVAPVVLFHAGFSLFSGGYVGVDVFFVISGYLITSIILTDMEAGTFSLAKFYDRRARRILPALFLVMLACLPFAWLWMSPNQLKAFAKSLVAVSLFVSNILFWRESGYFREANEEKPLLHTWSLAVEEQYYVLFPLLMIALWPLGRRWLVVLASLTAVLGLGLVELGWRRWPEANFYLLHGRCWELAVGALAAFYLRSAVTNSRMLREVMSGLGIVLIIGAAVMFTKATPFPSLYAIVPVGGALLVILYASPATLVGKLLSLKALVGLGLISYSTYLWHQPLFAFYRIISLNKPSVWAMLALIASAVGLAYLSWRFVEIWFRREANIRTLVASGVAGSLFFVGIGTIFYIYDLSRTFSKEQLAQMEPARPQRDVRRMDNCIPFQGSNFGFEICSQHPTLSRKALLYGDSHAGALYLALSAALAKSGVDLVILKTARVGGFECETLPGSFRMGNPSSPQLRAWCAERTGEIAHVANKLGAEHLFISMRWTLRLFPAGMDVTSLDFDNGEGGAGDASYREYFVFDRQGNHSTRAEDKYSETLNALLSIAETFKGTLVLVGSVPEVGWRVGNRNRKSIRLFGQAEETISTSYERFKQRTQLANRILHGVSQHRSDVSVIDPADVFCDTFLAGRCVAQQNYEPLYSDGNHLSHKGAELLSRHIVEQMAAK